MSAGEERSDFIDGKGFIDKNNPENAAQLVLFIRVTGILLHCDEQVVIHYDNEEEMCVVSSKFEIERD